MKNFPAHRAGGISLARTLALMVIAGFLFWGLPNAGAQAVSAASQGEKTPAVSAPNGRKLFATKGCAGCHGPEAQGTAKAPQIARTTLPFSLALSYVRRPTGQMPPYPANVVSGAEMADMYAFLLSVPRTSNEAIVGSSSGVQAAGVAPKDDAIPSGSAQEGRKLFVSQNCYQCHGREAQGTIAGPRLGPGPIPFAALQNYVRHPTGSMPPFTSKVISDGELANIYAFLQSLPQPPKAESIPALN